MIALCPAHAQDVAAPARSFWDEFSISLPAFRLDMNVPLRSSKIAGLPYGMNHLFYNTSASANTFAPYDISYNFKIAGLYYRDRIGVEYAYVSYGSRIDNAGFDNYLAARFPGYLTASHYYRTDFIFNGPRVGLAYKVHLKQFIIEPQLHYGFESADGQKINNRFMDPGSNQFLDHTIDQVWAQQPHSYSATLNLGRRFRLRKDGILKLEAGVSASYLHAPYQMDLYITEKPYGQPAVVNSVSLKDAFRMYSFGIYAAVYFINYRK